MGVIPLSDRNKLKALFTDFGGTTVDHLQLAMNDQRIGVHKFKDVQGFLTSRGIGSFKVERKMIDNGAGIEEWLIVQVIS